MLFHLRLFILYCINYLIPLEFISSQKFEHSSQSIENPHMEANILTLVRVATEILNMVNLYIDMSITYLEQWFAF